MNDALHACLITGPRSAGEIASRLRVSQQTVSRLTRGDPRVLQAYRARATRYALVDSLPDVPPAIHPVYQVDANGDEYPAGRIAAVAGGQFWYEDATGLARSGFYESLPWSLADLRPAGYLGAATVRAFVKDHGFPSAIGQWSERHVLASLVLRPAHDHIGALLVGQAAVTAYRQWRSSPIRSLLTRDEAARLGAYTGIVESMAAMGYTSSINGDYPKFAAEIEDPAYRYGRSVLVKFTGQLETDGGRRWSALLRAEQIALDTIRSSLGLEAAQAHWLSDGVRSYLEVERFDRTVAGGRVGMLSLAAVDAEFVGRGSGWTDVARELEADRLLEHGSANRLAELELFGELIGNSDRHLGNASVFTPPFQAAQVPEGKGSVRFRLTPAYDVLPMRYASTQQGFPNEPLKFDVALGLAQRLSLPIATRERVVAAAEQFWLTCRDDPFVTQGLGSLAAANLEELHRIAPLVLGL